MIVTNEENLPEPFVDAVKSDYVYRPKRYSVTTLTKGIKETLLSRRHADEITVDASERVWAIFGSAIHHILENSQETETQIKENKIAAEVINGYELSGIFDLYDDKTKVVTDYKTGSVWKIQFDEWDDFITQLLGYVWLLRQIGFDARSGKIVLLLKDHSISKAAYDKNYPQKPVFQKQWDFTDQDLKVFESFLKSRFAEIIRYEEVSDDEIPPCTPSERWARPTKYAAMKKGRKRAIKLFDDQTDADIFAIENGYYVEKRPGKDVKCSDYCSVKYFCDYYQKHYGEKDG